MKKIILSLSLILLSSGLAHAQSTLQLSTYYPAPFGVYNSIRLVPLGSAPACNANTSGLMYINSGTLELMVCNGTGWGPSIGIWSQSGSNISPTTIANSVGVGTSTPARRLHVRHSAADVMRVESTGGGSVNLEMAESSVIRSKLIASGANALAVENNAGTSHFILTQAGNVSIGNATPPAPAQKLFIDGANGGDGIRLNGTNPVIRLQESDTANQNFQIGLDSGQLLFQTNNDAFSAPASRLFLTQAGKVGILATPSNDPVTTDTRFMIGDGTAPLGIPAGNTWDRGHLVVSTTGLGGGVGNATAHAFFYVSDENFKENIAPVSGLDTIMRLNGIRFTWKETGEEDIGVTAQNVEEVFPELVNTSPSNLKTVKMGNLVAPLIEAIKEQQTQIEAMKKEIEELKARQF